MYISCKVSSGTERVNLKPFIAVSIQALEFQTFTKLKSDCLGQRIYAQKHTVMVKEPSAPSVYFGRHDIITLMLPGLPSLNKAPLK